MQQTNTTPAQAHHQNTQATQKSPEPDTSMRRIHAMTLDQCLKAYRANPEEGIYAR